ncbi:MAG: hypothetical protein M3464_10245 [Chloroflexota bacterium]|nr:hypothetical protein [Chloroflexota bacterium]
MENAVVKRREFGEALGLPHSSQIKGTSLRELRARRGRSPWRALYQRIGEEHIIVAAVGPEARHDPRGFQRAIAAAQDRINALKHEP